MTRCEGSRGGVGALHGDRHGAILLIGIFMCCILASLIWYLLGIGQAILWRDRGQEVADTIALTSASCHARGMNFIAFFNLLMLLVTAVFIIFRLIDYVLVGLALGIFTWVPGTQGFITPTWQFHDKLARGLAKYERAMERIFPHMGRLQIWVAHGAPWWGFASSLAVSQKYETLGRGYLGGPLSLSMADTDWLTRFQKARPDKPLTSEPKPPRADPPPDNGRPGWEVDRWRAKTQGDQEEYDKALSRWEELKAQNRQSYRQLALPQDFFGRLGLPVAADKFNILCTSALAVAPDMALQQARKISSGFQAAMDNPVARSAVTSLLRLATYQVKELLCGKPFWKSGQYTSPDPKDLQDLTTANEDPRCSDEAIGDQLIAGAPPRPGRPPPSPGLMPDRSQGGAALDRWNAANHAYGVWADKKNAWDKYHSREAVDQRDFRRTQLKNECRRLGRSWTQDDVIALQNRNRDKGPKLVVPYAFNGNDWMQVWSFVWAPAPDDSDVRHMLQVVPKIMRRAVADESPVEPANNWYFAQAEFYLDCHDRWFAACNVWNLATFKLAWRARLRRVKDPAIISDIVMMVLGSVVSSDWLRDRVGQVSWTKDENFLKNWISNVGFAQIRSNVMYEASLVADHGEYDPNVLH